MSSKRLRWPRGFLETLTQEEVKALQWRMLVPQLEHAYSNSPFYRRSFDVAGVHPKDIKSLDDYYAKVPFISKEVFIENQAKSPPFGDFLAVPRSKLRHLFYAPGPLMIPLTERDYDWVVKVVSRTLYIMGMRPGMIVDVTANYNWVIAGKLLDSGFRRTGGVVLPGGVGNSQTHIELLKLTRAEGLLAFPTFAQTLFETAKEMGIDPRRDLNIKNIFIFGEVRTEKGKRELSEAFGAAVRETYGTADLGLVAAECPEGGGMHITADNIFEVIDPATGKHVPWGEGGEVVGCDLKRQAMPVIRYRTGDITEGLNLEPCPCGLTTPRLKRILGRSGDIARIKGMFISPRQIEGVLAGYTELGRYQIIVERPGLRDELTICVECRGPVPSDDLRVRLIEQLKAALRVTPEVRLLKEGTIPQGARVVDDRRRV
ncbi:MAG: hypothetical protein AB1603_02550 [Chloroflexota bacterium]